MFLKERITLWRKKQGLTQEALAHKANVTKAAISNYENGHSTPSNDTLVAIANALHVSTDYLLGRTDRPEPLASGAPEHPEGQEAQEEELDIEQEIKRLLANLGSDQALAFHGEPMDEETKRLFAISLENSLRLAHELSKKNSFTRPEDYSDRI